jgi:hypothetical protein
MSSPASGSPLRFQFRLGTLLIAMACLSVASICSHVLAILLGLLGAIIAQVPYATRKPESPE